MTENANQAEQSARRAKIFAVTSGKGGVGKTSLTVNVACEVSRRGHRTIVIDADLGLELLDLLVQRRLGDGVVGGAGSLGVAAAGGHEVEARESVEVDHAEVVRRERGA